MVAAQGRLFLSGVFPPLSMLDIIPISLMSPGKSRTYGRIKGFLACHSKNPALHDGDKSAFQLNRYNVYYISSLISVHQYWHWFPDRCQTKKTCHWHPPAPVLHCAQYQQSVEQDEYTGCFVPERDGPRLKTILTQPAENPLRVSLWTHLSVFGSGWPRYRPPMRTNYQWIMN